MGQYLKDTSNYFHAQARISPHHHTYAVFNLTKRINLFCIFFDMFNLFVYFLCNDYSTTFLFCKYGVRIRVRVRTIATNAQHFKNCSISLIYNSMSLICLIVHLHEFCARLFVFISVMFCCIQFISIIIFICTFKDILN
jgi:hypothetical protein